MEVDRWIDHHDTTGPKMDRLDLCELVSLEEELFVCRDEAQHKKTEDSATLAEPTFSTNNTDSETSYLGDK